MPTSVMQLNNDPDQIIEAEKKEKKKVLERPSQSPDSESKKDDIAGPWKEQYLFSLK